MSTERKDALYMKNAAGLYVLAEPTSAPLMAAATTGDVLTVKSDDTVVPRTITAGTDITVTVAASTITIASTAAGGGGAVVLYDSGALGSPANAIDTGAAGVAGGYDLLEVWFIGRTDTANGGISITFNNDTGSNYGRQFVRGASTTVSATGDAPTGAALFAAVASTAQPANNSGIVTLTIPFYTDTTFYKIGEMVTGQADSGALANRSMTWAGFIWKGTAAITRMAFTAAGGVNFIAGSRLIIYGR